MTATFYSCPNCGSDLLGDGYHTVFHCENAEDWESHEPDAAPVLCLIRPAISNR